MVIISDQIFYIQDSCLLYCLVVYDMLFDVVLYQLCKKVFYFDSCILHWDHQYQCTYSLPALYTYERAMYMY